MDIEKKYVEYLDGKVDLDDVEMYAAQQGFEMKVDKSAKTAETKSEENDDSENDESSFFTDDSDEETRTSHSY